ncbi:MAG: arylsulfotransferase family protein [Solirubrobacteraceae bacterium]
MRARVWAVAVALLVGGVLAAVVPTLAARQGPEIHLTKWSGGSDPGLHVLPFPGTPDASPASQIILSSLTPSAVRSVRVVGSVSGRHAGHVVELPDGAGTAFVPDHQFAPRELVKVTALLRSAIAGTASGAPRARRLSFSFGVAATVADATSAPASKPKAPPAGQVAAPPAGKPAGPRAPKPTSAQPDPTEQHFHATPGLSPPVAHIRGALDSSSGDIFLTPANSRQHGPMILNSRGQLVWFDHISNRLADYNLELKTYRGRPVLTWWQGKFADAHGINGRGIIMDTSYRIVKVVRAGNGYTSDLHEFQVMPDGTAWIDCYVPVHANLTSQGGSPHGTVLDGVIQKIDIRTGRVLWEWHSLGHVPLTAGYFRAAGRGPYDYFHLNSIQELPGGKLIVSGRNTWAVYMVDERTGRIDWTLGGKDSDFRVGPGAEFEWQHDVILHRNGLMTVFDNADVPHHERSSSAKELRINTQSRTVSLIRRYPHSPPRLVGYMGSAQLLPNHDMLVGWGNTENTSEYAASGREIFNAKFPDGINSYRAYRFPWHGRPLTPPSVAVSRGPHGTMKIYAAWNGATEVARWRVLGGSAPDALANLGQAASRGFETGQWIHSQPRYLAVEALDAHGSVLGRWGPARWGTSPSS